MRKSSSHFPRPAPALPKSKPQAVLKNTHHTRTSSDDKPDLPATPQHMKKKGNRERLFCFKTERTDHSPLNRSLSPFVDLPSCARRSPKFTIYASPPQKKKNQPATQGSKKKRKGGKAAGCKPRKLVKKREVSPQELYQHFLMQQMGEHPVTEKLFQRRITQRSQQESSELIAIKQEYQRVQPTRQSSLRQKVESRYRKQLNTFSEDQLNFYCSVVMIQRWWRGRQAKNIIRAFIAPAPKEKSLESTLPLSPHIDPPRLIIRTQNNPPNSPQSQEKVEMSQKNLNTPRILEEEIDEILLEEEIEKSSELQLGRRHADREVGGKERKLGILVSSYREVVVGDAMKPLPTSLQSHCSEHSLLHRLYSCLPIHNHHPLHPGLQGNLHPDKKNCDTQTDQPLSLIDLPGVTSLKNFSEVSTQILQVLLDEACKQSTAIIGTHKIKAMPGMVFTPKHSMHFLKGLASHILETSRETLLPRLNRTDPFQYLQLYRSVEKEPSPSPSLSDPLLPNILFYEYQLQYQRQNLRVEVKNHKCANFLLSLFKLHNYMIANCLLEELEKWRWQRATFPWSQRLPQKELSNVALHQAMQRMVQDIVNGAEARLSGGAHLSCGETVREANLLVDGLQLSPFDEEEALELRLQLCEQIEELLLKEQLLEFLL